MRLLVLLAGRIDAPWTKGELMDQLWPAAGTGESSLTRAASELRRALDIRHDAVERRSDPAEAHAMIGVAERLVPLYCDRPAKVHGKRSRSAAEKAVALDAHCALGWAALASLDRDEWQWMSSLERFERTMALDSEDAFLLHSVDHRGCNLDLRAVTHIQRR